METDNPSSWNQVNLKTNIKTKDLNANKEINFGDPSENIFTFEEHGTGTILLYQNYSPLFYKGSKLERPIYQVDLRLRTSHVAPSDPYINLIIRN